MKVTLHVSWKKYGWNAEPYLQVSDYKSSDKDAVYCGTFDIELPAEFGEPTAAAFVTAKVDALKALQGVKQFEITQIQKQIDDLLCLEHKPEVAE